MKKLRITPRQSRVVDFGHVSALTGLLVGTYFSKGFALAFDVSETDEAIIVKAELPGVDPKELEVNLTGSTLTVKGKKKKSVKKNMHRIERSFGSFSRSITLPCEVKEDKIEATFKDGVLHLKLPKAESSLKSSIKIDVK